MTRDQQLRLDAYRSEIISQRHHTKSVRMVAAMYRVPEDAVRALWDEAEKGQAS